MRIHFSTTAVFPAIRCRCGRSFSSAPFLRAFWTALPFCPFPTLAAFPTIRCRCGATFSSAPFPLLTKELSKSLSHLPKVCRFPAFLSHLPKVRNRPGPSVAPVPAFLFPAASFHLPVSSCLFPPSEGVQIFRISVSPSKGAQSPGTLCSACTRVSVSSCLFPPSEGVRISRVSVSPSKGAQIPNRL